MTEHKIKIREYVLHHDPTAERWELLFGFGERDPQKIVAHSIPGEDKDAFESICRDYVRRNSIAAARNLPRRLRIRDVEGNMLETVSYDMDSY